jgi:NTP pyrophosphatase (non-canonical NTP hydrolase)
MGLKKDIIKWSAKNWPDRTPQDIEAKLYEELQELAEALNNQSKCEDLVNIAEELFDVYAMIIDYAYVRGINLKDMFKAKSLIIEKRKTVGKQKAFEHDIIRMFL